MGAGKRERAEQIYIESFGESGSLDAEALEALCAKHPELSAELLAVHGDCEDVGAILDAFTSEPGSLAERQHFEKAIDTDANWKPASGSPSSASSPSGQLLEQLAAARSPHSRYRIKGELARGAMGRILEVYDRDLRRSLAMKVAIRGHLSDSGAADSKDVRLFGRLLEEAQVTGQLEHPGIVPVHELGIDSSGRVFFTMPVVRGADLRTVLAEMRAGGGQWTRARLLNVLLSVCETLAYAHDRGVIHRDVKPANIMVGSFGEVYVMDWGLARVRGRAKGSGKRATSESKSLDTGRRDTAEESPHSPFVTGDGDVIGTPAYMPVEQARGETEALDARADVYAVGAMLYELLAGVRPYQTRGEDRSSISVLKALRDGPPKPLVEIAPDVNPELRAICERAMSREKEDRYPDARALAANLRAFLDDRVVDVFEGGAIAELKKWVQRNRGTAAALVGLVLVLISAAAIVAVVESDRVRVVRAAKTDVEKERDEKQALLDVRTAPVLLTEFDCYRPDVNGIARMHRGVATGEELLSRRSAHLALMQPGALPWPDLPTAELAQHLERLDEIEALLPKLRGQLEAAEAVSSRADDWSEVIADIGSSDAFDRRALTPQRGFVPLRKDPESGLWEFWHVLSGKRPQFDEATSGYSIEAETGMVFVLIPGGSFIMGSPESEQDRNVDEPQHPETVEAFFLSKYETTQSQWERARGFNPSYYTPGVERGSGITSILHPVESVTWFDADGLATVLDLRLPSEPEWEFACRAGSTAPYGWGYDTLGSEGMENFADASWRNWAVGTSEKIFTGVQPAPWDDGFPVTSPVGGYRANPLGVHDIYGNVSEWTSGFHSFNYQPVADSEAGPLERRERVARGGNHMYGPILSRCAMRQPLIPSNTNMLLGVRLARSVTD